MKSIIPLFFAATALHAAGPPDAYKISWDTPSQDSLDSMPLSGRLGAGANVWVQDGSIWLYLAHSGAFDEQGRLLKLGCVRLTPADGSLGTAGFSQELDPATGTISIRQGDFKASLWFAGETLIYQSESAQPEPLEVSFGSWRHEKRGGLLLDMSGEWTMTEDRVKADEAGFNWFHRNADHGVNVIEMAKGRGIEERAVHDATTRRVSGGAVAIDGGISRPVESAVQWQFWDGKAWTGSTQARKQQTVSIRLGAALDARPAKWRTEAKAALSPAFIHSAKEDELKRWNEFWSRSHIVINSGAAKDDPGFLIARNYALFRYMLACNRGGEIPLLFNGGIFTTDNKPGRITGNNNDELPVSKGAPTTPDFRRWTYCYFMSQNQRWLGWPNLANGDIDLLAPSLRFYRDRSATAASRAKKQGAEGVVYVEPLDIWGLCSGGVAPRPDGLCGAEHLTYHFSMGLEHAWMALQAHDTLGIPLKNDLPWIEGTVLFYDSFYRNETRKRGGREPGPDGKLLIYPACGLEYAGGATNPLEVVCGLQRVTGSLLKLPGLSASSRERLRRIQATLPEIPTGIRQGRESILAARSLEREYNKWEPVEMYAFWPYRLAGITRPRTLQLARDTWETIPADRARLCKQDYSWMANVANMAALAAPEEAQKRAVYKMANNAAPQARFPAFFGPGHDWLPDHNWGGSGSTGIQEMLLAPEPGVDGKLHLFPGWPAGWDVDFKLHAPGKTLVEGVLKGGKLVSLKVTPASREKDIVNWLGKHPEWKKPAPAASQTKPITASSSFAEAGYDAARANDGDLATRWASDFNARSGWLSIDLGREMEIGRVFVSEIEWPETREFTIEVKQGGTWKEVARGTTIGADKSIELAPVNAREIRLNVLKAERAININEFQVFAK
jgi:hypothetical protein